MFDVEGESPDAKFPGQHGGGIPPSPTVENPGQVYPKFDPQASPSAVPGTFSRFVLSSVTGNPYLFENALRKLDVSLSELIDIVENEEAATGSSNKGFRYLEKFKNWKKELMAMRDPQSAFNLAPQGSGGCGSPSEGGGLFVE